MLRLFAWKKITRKKWRIKMTEKKYRFYVERPVYKKCYEQVEVEADSEEEVLELCKGGDAWAGANLTEWEYDGVGEPEIVERHEL